MTYKASDFEYVSRAYSIEIISLLLIQHRAKKCFCYVDEGDP